MESREEMSRKEDIPFEPTGMPNIDEPSTTETSTLTPETITISGEELFSSSAVNENNDSSAGNKLNIALAGLGSAAENVGDEVIVYTLKPESQVSSQSGSAVIGISMFWLYTILLVLYLWTRVTA